MRQQWVKIALSAGLLTMGSLTYAPVRAATQQQSNEVVLEAVSGEGLDEKAARQDAFRNAIAQAVGVFVRADTLVQDYITQSDRVRTSSQGFIKSFTKLSESKAPDGVIQAVYRIVVSTQALKDDVKSVVGAEFRNVGHPTVAVVGWFKGRNRLESEVNETAVTALNRSLIERGYKVVDAYEIDRLRKEDAVVSKAAASTQASNFDQIAQTIANRLKADIYVTTYGSVGNGKASVATRMYNTYTGQIFGSETGYGSMSGVSAANAKLAVDQAITQSMKTVLTQVSQHWQDVIVNGQEFIVVLNGYKNGKQRRDFKRLLSQANGVQHVKQLNASGQHAEFSLHATASPAELFDEIIELAEAEGMKFVNDEAVMRGGRAVFMLKG